MDLVEEGFDLAVRIGELRDSVSLAARRLGTQYSSIGAAPAYVARHGLPASLEEMDGHAGIAYSRAGALSPWQVRDVDGQVRQARIQPQVSLVMCRQ
ncbi:LysR family transcriptional regulator [Caballeronia udeis]|uniref:LysR family transcriptional regulator n=1 Tax=Caballeronia udeis TaxID=1232866 RepID=A0A158IL69_9BURK|nr:LysR substrate-binding domain-containing protein [Caballeronia udeis]SAL57318.1 LysR family transcriptional regulator [Caballeronia udeis]